MLASFVDSARNPEKGLSIPLSIPERYYPQKGDVDASGARLLHSRLQRKIKDIVTPSASR